MQSLASLMSIKQNDIGNLDDFNDSDDDGEERRDSFGSGQATPVSGKKMQTVGFSQEHTEIQCSKRRFSETKSSSEGLVDAVAGRC